MEVSEFFRITYSEDSGETATSVWRLLCAVHWVSQGCSYSVDRWDPSQELALKTAHSCLSALPMPALSNTWGVKGAFGSLARCFEFSCRLVAFLG